MELGHIFDKLFDLIKGGYVRDKIKGIEIVI